MSFAKDCATSRRDPQVLSTFEQAGGLYGSDLSYVSGTSSRPLLGMTIGEAFDAAVRQWSEKTALVVRHQDIRWTYAELAARVDTFAAGLLSFGLEPGDRIGIWAPNRAEWVITQFATAKAGLILVNINPAYRSDRARICAEQGGLPCADHRDGVQGRATISACSAVLAPDFAGQRRATCNAAQAAGAADAVIQIGRTLTAPVRSRSTSVRNHGRRRDRARQARARSRNAAVRRSDQHSVHSGTTGAPKGATLTHHNILNNGFFIGEAHEAHAGRPAVHSGAVLSLLRHGARQPRLRHARRRMVYPGESFDPLADAGDGGEANAAPRCTACRPCSSPSSSIPSSARSISTACAPASWRARPARSRSCSRSSARCICARSPSPTA